MTRLHQRTIDILLVTQRLTGEDPLYHLSGADTASLSALYKDVFATTVSEAVNNSFSLKDLFK